MRLNSGDRVAIIAPASQFRGADRPLLPKAVELLESWGLHVKVGAEEGHHFYLAGPDAARARHLTEALASPDVRAIFCTRGGYGSLRLLNLVPPELNPSPKLIVGYSDVTALHLQAAARWPQVRLVHGPNVATQQLLGTQGAARVNQEALHRALFSSGSALIEPIQCLRAGNASGPLIGGCLSMIASTIGTPFAIKAKGCILFLEDTGEAPYRIDRMLTQMRLAGLFDGILGLVFGVMRGCEDPYNDLRSVISDLFQDTTFPIGFGLNSGHGEFNLALRLGEEARLDSAGGKFELCW